MTTIVVNGAKPLSGAVRISGSKNACLPIMAATLLNEQPVNLSNVPLLEDVRVMGEVMASVGAVCECNDTGHRIRVDACNVKSTEPPYELVNRMRASFLVLGPLVARFGEASVPLPGGCAIGARPVNEHLRALEALGAEITQEAGRIVARAKKLTGAGIFLNISSVGATENAIMAASLAEGETTVHNAAEEPEVVDLCNFLTRCGVEIEGTGTKTITIHGQQRISAAVDYSVIPDRIEAGTYMLAIIGTGGSGKVTHMRPDHLESLVLKLKECGVEIEAEEDWLSVVSPKVLKPANLRTEIYPGFPTDLQPQMTTVLTHAGGVSTVNETIFEQRLAHGPELRRMGAKLRVNGVTASIEGNAGCLSGVKVEAHDLRCAAALVIAGLMAEGQTQIKGLRHLRRGYEDLPEKVAGLGGDVKYVKTKQLEEPATN